MARSLQARRLCGQVAQSRKLRGAARTDARRGTGELDCLLRLETAAELVDSAWSRLDAGLRERLLEIRDDRRPDCGVRLGPGDEVVQNRSQAWKCSSGLD